MESTFYTIREVSDLLKVSVSTIRRSVSSGGLKAARVGSQKQIRISKTALENFLESTPSQAESGVQPASVETVGLKPNLNQNINLPSSNPTDDVRRIEGQTAGGIPWSVLNGDVRASLKQLGSETIDCAVTSPPYYWQRDYEVEGQIGHETSISGYVNTIVDSLRELKRALKKEGTFFLNLGDTYYSAKGRPHGRDDKHNGRQMMRRHLRAVDGPGLGLPRKSLIGIPWRVAIAMQDDGWTLRSHIVWQRPASPPEPTAHDRPWRSFEHIFLFSKGPKYWFNREGLMGEEDVWKFIARPENTGSHFAPYPRELVDRCLQCGCPPGGVVLDPFNGSGTTMVSAIDRGSPAIGIELKPEYADFSAQRIQKMFGVREGKG